MIRQCTVFSVLYAFFPCSFNLCASSVVVDEKDIIPLMEEEFPQLYLSPVTAKMMWQKQMRQISNLAKTARPRKPKMVEQRIEESKKKQEALMNIMRKDVEHNKRLVSASLNVNWLQSEHPIVFSRELELKKRELVI